MGWKAQVWTTEKPAVAPVPTAMSSLLGTHHPVPMTTATWKDGPPRGYQTHLTGDSFLVSTNARIRSYHALLSNSASIQRKKFSYKNEETQCRKASE